MLTGNGLPDRPHSSGNLRCFLCPRAGVLSSRHSHSCSEVDSARSEVLGDRDNGALRAGGCGAPYESHGAARRSPADTDACALWTGRVGAVASFRSPQLGELERIRRNFRDRRSNLDSRRSPRRVTWSAAALLSPFPAGRAAADSYFLVVYCGSSVPACSATM